MALMAAEIPTPRSQQNASSLAKPIPPTQMIGLFAYDGTVRTDIREYVGQGQVKRFFTDLLLRDDNVKVREEGLNEG